MRIWCCAVLLASTLMASGCVVPTSKVRVKAPETVRTVEEHILYASTNWSGDLRLVRPLIVTRSATLTLQPGTRIFFDIPEPAGGETLEPWILVLGSLVATGSPERPIVFSSVENRQNELEDMIQIQTAKEAHFRNCVFEGGPWGLHIHETPVDVSDCVFRGNFGGARFQGGRLSLVRNRFEGNRIGIRALKSAPVLEANTLTGNDTGIFLREGVRGATIRHNSFDNREYDLKLGEGQTDDVLAAENWWRSERDGKLQERIFDVSDSEGLGRVVVTPTLDQPWDSKPVGR